MKLQDFIPKNNGKIFREFTELEIKKIRSLNSTYEQVVNVLKLINDPEMSVNIFDLGLIYKIDIKKKSVFIEMTLTSATCPVADLILVEIEDKIQLVIESIEKVDIKVVWEPKWTKNMISEEGKFILEI